jgi:hypothetical protein
LDAAEIIILPRPVLPLRSRREPTVAVVAAVNLHDVVVVIIIIIILHSLRRRLSRRRRRRFTASRARLNDVFDVSEKTSFRESGAPFTQIFESRTVDFRSDCTLGFSFVSETPKMMKSFVPSSSVGITRPGGHARDDGSNGGDGAWTRAWTRARAIDDDDDGHDEEE